MNDGDRHELTAQERNAQRAVRDLPRPAAAPDFRARLKREFMAGMIESTLGESREDEVTGPSVVPLRPQPRRRIWPIATPVALAAALVLMFFTMSPPPRPEISGTNGVGRIVVDGVPYQADVVASIENVLAPTSVVEVADGASVDVTYPGSFVLRIASGSTMTLPDRPGRWFGKKVHGRLEAGEVSVLTFAEFEGGELSIATTDGQVVVYGTLVSVVTNDDLSCICLFEGTARVESTVEDLGYLDSGKRWVIYRDGSEPDYLDIAPPHLQHMQGLDRDH